MRMLPGLTSRCDQSRPVGGVERRRHALADVHGEVGAEPLLLVEQLAQALAVDELHHDRLARPRRRCRRRRRCSGGSDGRRRSPRGGTARRTTGSAASSGAGALTATWRDEQRVGRQPHLGHASLREATLQPVALGEHRRRRAAVGWRRRGMQRSATQPRRAPSAGGRRRPCGSVRQAGAGTRRRWCPAGVRRRRPARCRRRRSRRRSAAAASSTNWSTSVAVGVQHGEVLDRRRSSAQLVDEEGERLAARALLAALLDLAVAHLDDRLDRQHRGEQRLGAADAAALLQVLERVERAPHPGALGEVGHRGDDGVDVGARLGRRRGPATIMPEPSVTERLSTTSTANSSSSHRCGQLGRLCMVADSAPDRDTTRSASAPSSASTTVGLLELAGRGRRRLGEHGDESACAARTRPA